MKVRLRDVEVLTLYQGKMTTGRRSSPVLQLKCAGGSAGCSAFVPEVVQCYNRGWDGYDAQVCLFQGIFLHIVNSRYWLVSFRVFHNLPQMCRKICCTGVGE